VPCTAGPAVFLCDTGHPGAAEPILGCHPGLATSYPLLGRCALGIPRIIRDLILGSPEKETKPVVTIISCHCVRHCARGFYALCHQ
jgi:hypothetical protein